MSLFSKLYLSCKLNKLGTKFMFWFVWKLPKKLVYFCAIRVVSYATTGKYSNTEVPALTAMDAIQRWENK